MAAMALQLIPVLIKIVGWFIGRAQMNEQTKRKWLSFMEVIEGDLSNSAAMNIEDERQKDDIDEQWDKDFKK